MRLSLLKHALLGAAAATLLATSSVLAGELIINANTSDPAPKKAMNAIVDGFKAKNPDVTVTLNIFDHEGYKAAIRNFLTADAPERKERQQ